MAVADRVRSSNVTWRGKQRRFPLHKGWWHVVTRLHEAIPDELNPWLRVTSLIEKAGHLLGLDDGMIKRIVTPERILEVAVPVRMDYGRRPDVHRLAHPAQHRARSRARAASASTRA